MGLCPAPDRLCERAQDVGPLASVLRTPPPQHLGAVLCRLWLSGGGELYKVGASCSTRMYCRWWVVGPLCLHCAILGIGWGLVCAVPHAAQGWINLRQLENLSEANMQKGCQAPAEPYVSVPIMWRILLLALGRLGIHIQKPLADTVWPPSPWPSCFLSTPCPLSRQ